MKARSEIQKGRAAGCFFHEGKVGDPVRGGGQRSSEGRGPAIGETPPHTPCPVPLSHSVP